jgi:glycosyltransferase involved in cell wall biosynthesis
MHEPPKRIWLVNLFFGLGVAPTGALLESLAVALKRIGWQVEVLTGDVGYNQSTATNARRFDGTVHTLRTGSRRAAGFGGRLLSWILFYLRVTAFAFTHRLPDQVLIMTTPPLMHLVFVVRRWFSPSSTELILWNQDTYPEVLAAVGMLRRNSLVYRLLLYLERFSVRRTDKIVVLDRAMRAILENHGGKSVLVIPNWEIDLPDSGEPLDPRLIESIHEAKARYRYLVLYSGNYGWGHNLTILFDHLQQHADQRTFFFLFLGGGEKWAQLLQLKEQSGLDCLAVFPYIPKAQMPALVEHADFGLVTLDRSCVGLMSPSKIHGFLVQGKPLLYLGADGSNVADAIADYGCGVQIEERDCRNLTATLDRIEKGLVDLREMSRNARRAATERYTDGVGVAAMMQLLRPLSDPKTPVAN